MSRLVRVRSYQAPAKAAVNPSSSRVLLPQNQGAHSWWWMYYTVSSAQSLLPRLAELQQFPPMALLSYTTLASGQSAGDLTFIWL